MFSVAQFVALGNPDFTPEPQQEWFFDLPDRLDVRKNGVLLFRINPVNSPHIRVYINDKKILDRPFAQGMTVSYHVRIPLRVLQVGQNRLLFESNVPDEEGFPSGLANFGDPVVHYHILIPDLNEGDGDILLASESEVEN